LPTCAKPWPFLTKIANEMSSYGEERPETNAESATTTE